MFYNVKMPKVVMWEAFKIKDYRLGSENLSNG